MAEELAWLEAYEAGFEGGPACARESTSSRR
jgi:hypothetical protein